MQTCCQLNSFVYTLTEHNDTSIMQLASTLKTSNLCRCWFLSSFIIDSETKRYFQEGHQKIIKVIDLMPVHIRHIKNTNCIALIEELRDLSLAWVLQVISIRKEE